MRELLVGKVEEQQRYGEAAENTEQPSGESVENRLFFERGVRFQAIHSSRERRVQKMVEDSMKRLTGAVESMMVGVVVCFAIYAVGRVLLRNHCRTKEAFAFGDAALKLLCIAGMGWWGLHVTKGM